MSSPETEATKPLVLFVDDQPDLKELVELGTRLYDPPFTTAFASNVEDALRVVRERKPAAVIIDVNLSGETGMDVAESLHEFHPEIVKAVLTAYDRTTTHANAEQFGMEVWGKPLKNVVELIERVVGLLATRRDATGFGGFTSVARAFAAVMGLFSGAGVPRFH